jgi:hypothetical protein
MKQWRGSILVGVLGLIVYGLQPLASQPPMFDRLREEDRQAFQQRFKRELWPLLRRGGKDGCVGCHHASSRNQPRFADAADKDFRMLLREGYFLHEDSGNLLERVATRDRRRRMPPGNRPAWTENEVRLLRQFIADLDKKQQ